MTLGQVIEKLSALPADMVFANGFSHPHSYRGYYSELAFEPTPNTTVANMLTDANGSVGKVFQGWKGGDYEMHEHVDVYLAQEGDTGEMLTRTFFENAELRAEIERLCGLLYGARCVYCGEVVGKETLSQELADEVLREHILKCPKHPATALRTANAELTRKVGEARELIREIHAQVNDGNSAYCVSWKIFDRLTAFLKGNP